MLTNGILPATRLYDIAIAKITLAEIDSSKLLAVKYQNIIPYASSYFDTVKYSENSVRPRSKLISSPDNFSFVSEKDYADIFSTTMNVNHLNSKMYERTQNDHMNVVKLSLDLPFHYYFLDENFWYNSVLYVPTMTYDEDEDAWEHYMIKNAILESASFSMSVGNRNTCTVTIYVPFIDLCYKQYDISNWLSYDFCPTKLAIDRDLDLKSINYSKTSTVALNSTKRTANSIPMYEYDIFSDRIDKWNGFLVTSPPSSYSLDANFYATQSFYEEKVSLSFLKYDMNTAIKDLYTVYLSGDTFALQMDVFTDSEKKDSSNEYSISGKGVLKWL